MRNADPLPVMPMSRPVDSRSPFVRLTELLGETPPGKPPISLAVGEPQHPIPSFVGPVLMQNLALFGKYPPNKGTNACCEAAAGWLNRRYSLSRPVDPVRTQSASAGAPGGGGGVGTSGMGQPQSK